MPKNVGKGSGGSAGQRAPESGGNPLSPSALAAERMVANAATFQDRVKAAAGLVPDSGRFGENKVFISEAHKAYEQAYGRIPIGEFKAKLVEANREGLVNLVRADLVQAMDFSKIQASKTSHLNAEFHFIKLPHRWDARH